MTDPPDEPISASNGTYVIDIPTGVNPQSYAIQVKDSRGITVAASSFSHYTASLMFNSSTISGGDYINQYNSSVDSVADQGTHSNFTAQQQGPDNIFDTLTEANIATAGQNYNPGSYVLDGSTTLVSGSLGNLAQDDGSYLTFGSYETATSPQTLYVHKETTNIAGINYNNFLLTSADSSGATLTASMGSSRTLLGKSVYSLQGISSIPASTWTLDYRAWQDSVSTVSYDAAASTASTGVSSFSWNHNVGAGNNRLLVVTVSTSRDGNSNGPATVTGVTYNGVSMTQQVTDVYTSNSNPQVRSYIFYLKNPTSGTHAIHVTLSGNSNAVGGSVSYANVSQSNPIQAQSTTKNYGSSQLVSLSTTSIGQAVYGSLGSYKSASYTVTPNSGETYRWGQTSQNYKGDGEDELTVSPGSASVGWTTSQSVGYVGLAIVINPSASSAVGHLGVDVLIRKADNTIRQTVATDVAQSGSLTTSASTLSGNFNWPTYTVVSQTDYVEIDFYVDSTTVDSSNAYLMIDNNTLALIDQTRVTNVKLPSQYTCQAELSGTSNLNNWNNILWAIDASSTLANVNAAYQLYNYNSGQYSASGNGYLATTLGTSITSANQNITANPTYFRDSIGSWKMRFTITSSTATPFNVNVDSSTFTSGIANYGLNLEEQFSNLNFTSQLHPTLCINAGNMGLDNLALDVWHAGAWQPLFAALTSGWNNVSVGSYLDSGSPSLTIRFRSSDLLDTVQSSWQIDASLLRPESDQAFFLSLPSSSSEVAVEILQNGTMVWLGQNLSLTTQTVPIPPVPVKAINVNETIDGVNQQVPFQIEDWASAYTVPLGLTNNATVFGNRQMIVFLLSTHVSDFTIWWNGSDEAIQSPLAYTSNYFNGDNPSAHTITNGELTLGVSTDGKFTVTSTVGSTSSTATYMRINNQASTYGASEAYVIHNGVIRDIIQQESEWSNGVSNCPNLYANIVLTLPANATYYTYQLNFMFMPSQQGRTITDLCPIALTSSVGQLQTENGTFLGSPIVANGTQTFSDSTGVWAHHWSQFTDGTNGAGLMFTDQANQMLYAFDTMSPATFRGALLANSSIYLLPINLSPVSFQTSLELAWYGAVATFDASAIPIYNGTSQPGLWILAELPPIITVSVGN